MNIPVNLFMWIMAFLPIAALLILMIKCGWGATEAAPVGLLITVVTGVAFYKADITLLASESAKGVWNALIILIIVWTAILMYQVGDEAKAFLVIRNGMRKLLPNELLLVLAMGWIFESFLQGITGFGVPVAVGAPLIWTAIGGFATCWFYGKGKALKKGFVAVAIMAVIQGGGELLLTQVSTTLACFIPAVISLVVILLLGRTKMYKDEWCIEDSPIMNRDFAAADGEEEIPDMTLVQAFVPYFALSIITLVVLLVKPLNTVLGQFKFGFAFPETSTGYGYVNKAVDCFSPLAPFTHASMFLFVSAIIGLVYYKKHGWIGEGGTKRVFVKSVSMTMPSGIAVIGLVIMSKIMDGTGQTVVLANGIANVLGKVYIIFAPFVGLLGTFMTGSNMSSNILFGSFQMTTAKLLGANTAAILGAQSAGGAIGAAISPSKIILGTTTASILGSEGEVMKKLMAITIPSTILIGAVLFVMTAL